MRLALACLVVAAGCHSHERACAPKLAELAKLYEAVAADNAVPAIDDRLEMAPFRIRRLPAVPSGAPVDATHADLLLVGPFENALVKGDGTATVLVIDAETPWSRIDETLHDLRRDHATNVSVAYRVRGALADRKPPSNQNDLPTIGDAIAKTTATHCPAYAKQLAALRTGTTPISDPSFLRGLATALPSCDCGVDLGQLELMPWIVATPLVTTVPLAATAPGHDAAQTWGDLVAAAKGPVPLALPELAPVPPPPPRPRHR